MHGPKISRPPLSPSPPSHRPAGAWLCVKQRVASQRPPPRQSCLPPPRPPRHPPLPSRAPPHRPRLQAALVPSRLLAMPASHPRRAQPPPASRGASKPRAAAPASLQAALVPPRFLAAPASHPRRALPPPARRGAHPSRAPLPPRRSRMHDRDTLAVRFHFGDSFQSIDGIILYVGGDIGMSYIELDKISLPEIKGHLEDHFKTVNVVRMHWLKPSKELSNGLVLLVVNM